MHPISIVVVAGEVKSLLHSVYFSCFGLRTAVLTDLLALGKMTSGALEIY